MLYATDYLKDYLGQCLCGSVLLLNKRTCETSPEELSTAQTTALEIVSGFLRLSSSSHSTPLPAQTIAIVGLPGDLCCGIVKGRPFSEEWWILGPFQKPAHLWLRYVLWDNQCEAASVPGILADMQLSNEKMKKVSEKDTPFPVLSSIEQLTEAMLLLYYHYDRDEDSPITKEMLLLSYCTQEEKTDHVQQTYNNLLFHNMEHNIIHNPYNQEVREYTAVENGDVDELMRIQKEDYSARNGVLSEDPIRNEIGMGIVVTTLARAAAARGGLTPEICYSLSDATIQEIDLCQDIATIRHIYRQSELHYAQLVRDQKNRLADMAGDDAETNLHINHCKDYIFSHLHSKLTVRQIADAVGLEANYLSALFHRHEHITLKHYILREKISLAKNMLVYSPYSYIEIANYLGFSSQSHLGEQFRRITGMTMKAYREAYGKEDFLQQVVDQENE